MNLSLRKTKELAKNLRAVTNVRKFVEKDAAKKVASSRHILDKYFVHENIVFVDENS